MNLLLATRLQTNATITMNTTSAVLWNLWSFLNDLIFNHQHWLGVHQIWRLTLQTLRMWSLLFKEEMQQEINSFCKHISSLLRAPVRLSWKWKRHWNLLLPRLSLLRLLSWALWWQRLCPADAPHSTSLKSRHHASRSPGLHQKEAS